MPRIRTTKPEFWTSEQVVSCSRDARLLFIGLWNFCDDAGIYPASIKQIKMQIFPGDNCSDEQITTWINELITAELLTEYIIANKRYWIVTGWHHQKIDKPYYRYPKPTNANNQEPQTTSDINSTQSDSHNHNNKIPEYNSPNSGTSFNDHSTDDIPPFDHHSSNDSRIVDECSPAISPWKGEEDKGKEKDISMASDNLDLITAQFSNFNTDAHPDLKSSADSNRNTETTNNTVIEIFEYWKLIMNHPNAKLDEKRKKQIINARKLGYSTNQLKLAIYNCSKSSFHMGQNDRQTRYDGICLILKDAEHIECFLNQNISTTKANTNSSNQINNIFEGAI